MKPRPVLRIERPIVWEAFVSLSEWEAEMVLDNFVGEPVFAQLLRHSLDEARSWAARLNRMDKRGIE